MIRESEDVPTEDSGPRLRGLTLDLSGGWRQAKLAGRRPLEGRVRRQAHEGSPDCVGEAPATRTGCKSARFWSDLTRPAHRLASIHRWRWVGFPKGRLPP